MEEFAHDVRLGLTAEPKELSSRWFYDTRGSEIFQDITNLEEYYLTRCEYEILRDNRDRISNLVRESARLVPEQAVNLVELGSGDGHKSFLLIEQFLKDQLNFEYVPIDISHGALVTLMDSLREKHPDTRARALEADYFRALGWLNQNSRERNFVLFLGSNIGNFNPRATHGFLCRLWSVLNAGDLVLIGFDLKKEISVLRGAYDDDSGVTREFNLNLLRRINRELDADFEPEQFDHYAVYNPMLSAMESYLISARPQEVHIGRLNRTFSFETAEPIHMEYSYKYYRRDIQALAENNGFEVVQNIEDSRGYFVDSIWRVKK